MNKIGSRKFYYTKDEYLYGSCTDDKTTTMFTYFTFQNKKHVIFVSGKMLKHKTTVKKMNVVINTVIRIAIMIAFFKMKLYYVINKANGSMRIKYTANSRLIKGKLIETNSFDLDMATHVCRYLYNRRFVKDNVIIYRGVSNFVNELKFLLISKLIDCEQFVQLILPDDFSILYTLQVLRIPLSKS